ncbi:MAG: ThiF family adenylyltransferase [Alphaproteobacteria bacterium]|nr:ThiF family adenylyltransferase [Alphaproteobacteria bacterium]MBV9372325.1 ThiF family adenylyltransferase [Alphaproteobacteria bacterium]MBV9899617.1 ThiF family adenylyltransferase [Alphaproteobacteria bacterium]
MPSEILRLQSSYSYLPVDEDRLAVVSTVLQRRVTLRGSRDRVARALDALAGGVDAERAADAVAEASGLRRDEAERLVAELQQAAILVKRRAENDVSSLDGKSLYDRQIRFLSLFESPGSSGMELNRSLQDRKVVIPGVGGTGGWIALMCARIGIRNIVVIDWDEVELSNLHRQILYERSDIGRSKVEAASGRLSGIDDDVQVTGHNLFIERAEDVEPLFRGADLVFNAFPPFDGNFAVGAAAIARAALQAGVPCLQSPAAQCVGPLTIPGKTACQRCARDVLEANFSYATKVVPSLYNAGFVGAISPRQAITSGLAVWEAARFLSGMDRPPTLDGTVRIDIAGYANHEFIPIARRLDCEECASYAATGADQMRA